MHSHSLVVCFGQFVNVLGFFFYYYFCKYIRILTVVFVMISEYHNLQ